MTEKRIRHLPVVDDGKLRGVISIGDLVKHVISTQSATIEHLESYIRRLRVVEPMLSLCRSHIAYAQTVFPPTIVRTARPFSFQPSNGVLRESDSNFDASTVHSRSGSISVNRRWRRSIGSRFKLQQFRRLDREHFNQPVDRNRSSILCTSRSMNNPSSVSRPTIPKGAAIEFDFLFERRVRRMIAAENSKVCHRRFLR